MPNNDNTRDLPNETEPAVDPEEYLPPADPYHPHIVIHMMGKRYEMNPPKRSTPKKGSN